MNLDARIGVRLNDIFFCWFFSVIFTLHLVKSERVMKEIRNHL